jgi:hypothetical protein
LNSFEDKKNYNWKTTIISKGSPWVKNNKRFKPRIAKFPWKLRRIIVEEQQEQ